MAGRPVMFRAGGTPSGVPAFSSTPARTYVADLSEFQPDVSDPPYVSWSKAVILRAAYGCQHDDAAWQGGTRRDGFWAAGIRWMGIYQYLVADQDPAAQAGELVRLVGRLRPGEVLIDDLEEGDGDQSARHSAWGAVIDRAFGPGRRLGYSGLVYAAAHGLRPEWVAAYQGDEPAAPHLLWQFTDSYPVPGVGRCDCSVYHGTVDDLIRATSGPAPETEEETAMADLLSNGPGAVTPLIVPDGATKIRFAADPQMQGLGPCSLRVALSAGKTTGTVQWVTGLTWDTSPAEVDLGGAAVVSVSRRTKTGDDQGNVNVAYGFVS